MIHCMIPLIDSETAQIILNLFANNHLKFEMVNVQKQVGSNDCGLFSIANSVQLAKKSGPSEITCNETIFD